MTENDAVEIAPVAGPTGTAYRCRHGHPWHPSATEAGFCSMQAKPAAAPLPKAAWGARITRISSGESGARIFEIRLQTPERRTEMLAIAEASARSLFTALGLDLEAALRAFELARSVQG